MNAEDVKQEVYPSDFKITSEEEMAVVEEECERFSLEVAHSLPYTRIYEKTQVVTLSEFFLKKRETGFSYEEHFACDYDTRNRGTHTDDVRWSGKYLAIHLNLSHVFMDAAAKGHDIAQPPFSHEGGVVLGKEHALEALRIFRIYNIPANEVIDYAVANHSDGDKKILNKEIVYTPEQGWKRGADGLAIADDVSNAAADPMDVINSGYEAERLIEIVCEALKIPRGDFCTNKLNEYHYRLLKFFLDDLVKNSRGKNGFFWSKEVDTVYWAIKKEIYQGFHLRPEVQKLRAENTEKLAAVKEEVIIIAQKDIHKARNRLCNDFWAYNSKANYSALPIPTIEDLANDFVTAECTEKSIRFYHKRCLK